MTARRATSVPLSRGRYVCVLEYTLVVGAFVGDGMGKAIVSVIGRRDDIVIFL